MSNLLGLAHALKISQYHGFVPEELEVKNLAESGDIPKKYANMDLSFLENYIGMTEFELADEIVRAILIVYE